MPTIFKQTAPFFPTIVSFLPSLYLSFSSRLPFLLILFIFSPPRPHHPSFHNATSPIFPSLPPHPTLQVKFFASLSSSDERRLADAVVFGIRSNGLLLFIPRYGIKGAVYLVDKAGQVAFVEAQV